LRHRLLEAGRRPQRLAQFLVLDDGTDDHGQVARLLVLAQGLEDAPAIHLWHHYIEQHDIRPHAPGHFEGQAWLSKMLDVPGAAAQVAAIEFNGTRVILGDQDSDGAAAAQAHGYLADALGLLDEQVNAVMLRHMLHFGYALRFLIRAGRGEEHGDCQIVLAG